MNRIVFCLKENISFLNEIQLSPTETTPEENLRAFGKLNDTWAEVAFLAAGVIQWMVSTNCVNEDAQVFVSSILRDIDRHLSDEGRAEFKQNTEKYTVLSYLLFAFENKDIDRNLSAYIMQFLEPAVQREMYCSILM